MQLIFSLDTVKILFQSGKKCKLKLTSDKVENEVEAELGNIEIDHL